MGSMGLKLPFDLSPTIDLKAKLKGLIQEAKQVQKDTVKTAKKSGQVSAELLQKQANINEQIKKVETQINDRRMAQMRSQIRANAEARKMGAFEGGLYAGQLLKFGIGRARHLASSFSAIDDPRQNGLQAAGGIISAVGGFVPGPLKFVAMALGHSLEALGGLRAANDKRTSSEIGIKDNEYRHLWVDPKDRLAAIAQRHMRLDDEGQGARDAAFRNRFGTSSLAGNALDFKKWFSDSSASGKDRELAAQLQQFGVSTKDVVSLRDEQRYAEQMVHGGAIDRIQGGLAQWGSRFLPKNWRLSSEATEAAVNQRIAGNLTKYKGEQKQAAELFNVDRYNQLEQAIHSEPGTRNIPWRSAEQAIYQAEEVSTARRAYALSTMQRAASRTGD